MNDIRPVLIVIVLLLMMRVSATLAQDDATPEATPESTEAAAATVATGDYFGRNVAARGTVDLPINPRAFLMTNVLSPFDTGSIVVVDLSEEGMDFAALTESEEDITLVVNGTVSDYDTVRSDLETLLQGDYDGTAFDTYETTPIIAATALHRVSEIINADPIVGDPAAFHEEQVAVEGKLTEAPSRDVFVIVEEDLVGDDSVLVVNGAAHALDLAPMLEDTVFVHGTVRALAEVRGSFAEETGATFDPALVAGYSDTMPVIVADAAFNLDDVTSIESVLDNPAWFENRVVTIEAAMDDALGDNAYLLKSGDLRLPVIALTDDSQLVAADFTDQNMIVRGTIRVLDIAALESEFGVDLDDTLLADYAGTVVLLAGQVFAAPIASE